MFVGMNDSFISPIDTRRLRDQLSTIIHYEEMDNFDHSSFLVGKDMSYLTEVLQLTCLTNWG